MPEFWVASGHQLTRLNAAGRMVVTPELVLAWLARPEIVPPEEACAAERDLHAALMSDPMQAVPKARIDAMADADARENWSFLITLRDMLVRSGSIEEGYLALVQAGTRLPVLFYDQLVQLILRNALDGCTDTMMLRAAEMFFRPQKAHTGDGGLLLADLELVEEMERDKHANPLMAMLNGGVESLDVLTAENGWTYWSRSDAHVTVFPFGTDFAAREAMARVIRRFVGHLLRIDVEVTPLLRADNVDMRWYVGLDEKGTAIGNALWKGKAAKDTLVGLFALHMPADAAVVERAAGHPVYLLLGMGGDDVIRMKPQNLVTGLPLAPEVRH